MKKEDKIKELEERIKQLELKQVIPVYQPFFVQPLQIQEVKPYVPFHLHGPIKCYSNPCSWC